MPNQFYSNDVSVGAEAEDRGRKSMKENKHGSKTKNDDGREGAAGWKQNGYRGKGDLGPGLSAKEVVDPNSGGKKLKQRGGAE